MQTSGNGPEYRPGRAIVLSAVLLAVAVTLGFGALAVEHAFALLNGSVEASSHLLARATTDALIFGEQGMRRVHPLYLDVPWRMAAHFFFGGAALLLGALQFVPRWRRRYPRLHRASGLLIWLATLLTMLGALGFLFRASLHEGVSGAGFQIVLWANAITTLVLLYQAVASALSRDFRSHMVWMAMVFASLATAPMLRIDWVLLSYVWTDALWDALNLAGVTFVLAQTVLAMGLWLNFVGDRDLPAKAAGSAWPCLLTWLLCAASAGVVLHEAVLAPNGIDAWGALRPAEDRLPPEAALWAAGMIAALLLLPANWARALHGQRLQAGFSVAVLLAAAGAAVMAVAMSPVSMEAAAGRAFWGGYALLLLVLLAFARWLPLTSQNRNAWGVLLGSCLWFPLLVPGLELIGLVAGATFAEAQVAAFIVGYAGPLYFGCAYAHGARLRLWSTTRRQKAAMMARAAW
jgi:hypothetical protein